MTRRLLKANDLENVAAGQTALLRVPVGDFSYEGIVLRYKESGSNPAQADTEAAITKIEVLADNVAQQVYSAEELNVINTHLGRAPQAGQLPLPLMPNRLLPEISVAEGLAWGTANLGSLTVKVDIDSGATSPTLEAFYIGRPERRELGSILQFEQLVLDPPASNAKFRILNQENFGRPIVALFADTANMTFASYMVGRQRIWDEFPIEEFDDAYDNDPILAPVSNWSILNFASSGRLTRDAMPIAAEGRPLINQTIEMFMTSASAFDAVAMLVGPARA